ncbi:MAG: alpha-L-fucosidase [Lachnospiraceae bacterium]|nr:alpha-L-fucosidase [Lachnospiraceae bacterium]
MNDKEKAALDARLTAVRPTERQIRYEDMEFTGFIHFTVNTFTGKEWGDGTEKEEIFCPEKLDALQWVKTLKSAGMKGVILTCKHHDGFCLWPSKYTKHTVASSKFRNGRGDVVREVSDACRAEEMAFGVYLSPWDRNNEFYGQGKAYDDIYVGQLTELLTGYGDIFCVWLDGACGEGPNGKKQVYDWDRYFGTIRKLQPGAVINVCGPDVRWCGNEAGDTREAEWSVVPARCADTERIKENSQKADDESFRQRKISAGDRDLGSREILENEKDLIWYPAEVDVSVRPGWFYHEEEDTKVRSLENLKDLYLRSVGGNANLLLNVPPDKNGLIAKGDVKRLRELGDFIHKAFGENITDRAEITVSEGNAVKGFAVGNVLKDDDTFFRTAEGCVKATVDLSFPEPQNVGYLVLQEQIRESQRIERGTVMVFTEDGSVREHPFRTVGHKLISKLDTDKVKKIRISVEDARGYVTLKFVGIYRKA